jgi:phosphoserine phosphatase
MLIDENALEAAALRAPGGTLAESLAIVRPIIAAYEAARSEDALARSTLLREISRRLFDESTARGIDPVVITAAIECLADQLEAEVLAIRKSLGSS